MDDAPTILVFDDAHEPLLPSCLRRGAFVVVRLFGGAGALLSALRPLCLRTEKSTHTYTHTHTTKKRAARFRTQAIALTSAHQQRARRWPRTRAPQQASSACQASAAALAAEVVEVVALAAAAVEAAADSAAARAATIETVDAGADAAMVEAIGEEVAVAAADIRVAAVAAAFSQAVDTRAAVERVEAR